VTARQENTATNHSTPSPQNFDSDAATIQVLKTSLEALEKSNQRLRDQRWSELALSKGIVIFAGAIVALVFGTNAVREYFAVSDIKARAEKMDLTASKLKEAMEEQIKKSEKSLRDVDLRFEALESNHKKQLAAVHDLQTDGAIATQSALWSLSLANAARDQLTSRHNALRAQYYAKQAEETLKKALRTTHAQNDSSGVFKELQATVFTLRANCAWQLGEFSEVRRCTEQALKAGGDLEAEYLQGLVKLRTALDEESNKDAAYQLIRESIESFRKVVELPESSPDQGLARLFLIAAAFEDGRLTYAEELAEQTLANFPQDFELRKRLPTEAQAQIVLTSVWNSLAKFCQGKQRVLAIDSSCDLDVGTIGIQEGKLLQRLLERFIRQRNSRFTQQLTAYEAGLFSADVLGMLREASHGPGCGSGGPGEIAPQQLIEQLNLYPPLSKDRSLAQVENGHLQMRHIRLVKETRTRLVSRNGEERDETYDITIPVIEKVEYDEKVSDIPELRYIPYNGEGHYVPGSISTEAGPPAAPAEAGA
jgi:hypothetical protein